MTILLITIALLAGLALGFIIKGITLKKQLAATDVVLSQQQNKLKDKKQALETMLALMVSSAANSQSKMTVMMSSIFDKSSDLAQTSAASLAEIAQNVKHSRGQVQDLNENMTDLNNKSQSGLQIALKLSDILNEFKETTDRLSGIQAQFSQIQSKANEINSVGQNAEMLALNAAIEAARAGEMGRGFAVVADSMKSLAKSSQEMSTDIQTVVNSSTADIIKITDHIQEHSSVLLDQTQTLVNTYNDVSETISNVDSQVDSLDEEFNQTLSVVEHETNHTRTAMEDLVREFTLRANEASGLTITDLAPHQAKQMLSSFDYLIDVRQPTEYNDELGHIEGTQLLTLQTKFPEEIKKLPRDKKYLFICRSGGRSTKAAQQALMLNFKEVYNLDGGMIAWRKASL